MRCLKSVPRSIPIALSFSIADLYVVLSQFHFYALNTDKYIKKARCRMANAFRTVWAKIQVTQTIVASGIPR